MCCETSFGEDGESQWEMLNPITASDVTEVLRGMRNTAVGPDKLSAKELLKWHQGSIAGLLNVILAVEALPSSLSAARVAFIPKGEIPTCPEEFRPISITSVLARTMHKILARRMMDKLEFSDFQFAFLKRDGCLEASMLLHSILRNAHDSTKAMRCCP